VNLLSARNLSFSYQQRQILRDVQLDIAPGEFVGLVGPNGAGKSTLLRILLGILTPDRGEVRFGDRPLNSLARREIARRAAFLPQGARCDFDFKVSEVVALGRLPHLGRFKSEGKADHDAVSAALRRTQTWELADRTVTELSGGERQRVFLARCLAQEAPLLVLDEPTANLDLRHAFALLDLVRAEVDRGSSAIAALHDLHIAARVCDRIVVIDGGAVAACGKPFEVLTAERLASTFGVVGRVTCEEGRLTVSVIGPTAGNPGSA